PTAGSRAPEVGERHLRDPPQEIGRGAGCEEHLGEPGLGQSLVGWADVRVEGRRGADRGHHELHQHVEPFGHARRRPARSQSSRARTDYFTKAGVLDDLASIGFDVVGYGCTTCIGNSGPLKPEISAGVKSGDLIACSVLSGNRNFEGRVHPEVRMNFLASPPLVVAYALAGTLDIDLTK